MTFGINTTREISKLSNFTRQSVREITYNNFEISPVVFTQNITTNHAITYTNSKTDAMDDQVLQYSLTMLKACNILEDDPK